MPETKEEKAAREFDARLTWGEGSNLTLPKEKPAKTLAQLDEEHAEGGGEPLVKSDGPTVHVYLPEEEG